MARLRNPEHRLPLARTVRVPFYETPEQRAARSGGGFGASFYRTPEWIAFRAAIVRERGRTCQQCGTKSGRMFVDHVVELRDGGPALDRDNIQILCAPCHNRKTATERRNRAAAPAQMAGDFKQGAGESNV